MTAQIANTRPQDHSLDMQQTNTMHNLPPAIAGDQPTPLAQVQSLIDAATKASANKLPVRAATTAALPANTYNSSAKTLTGNASGALPAQDGISLIVGNRMLVKNEPQAANNGPYIVSVPGSGSASYVLTRASDYDEDSKVHPGDSFIITEGATYADKLAELATDGTITLGTSALNFVIQAVQTYAGGNGIDITGGVISIAKGATSGVGNAAQTIGYQKTATFIVGDGTTTSFDLTHNGNTLIVSAVGQVISGFADNGTAVSVNCKPKNGTDLNVATVTITPAPATGSRRIDLSFMPQ